MIGLDSNIFIYLLESNVEFGQLSLALFKTIEATPLDVTASELVFLEVLSSPRTNEKQLERHKTNLQKISVDYQKISKEVLLKAAELRRQHDLGAMDSIHVANSLLLGASHFVTNDIKLLKKQIKNIKIVPLKKWQDCLPEMIGQ